MEDNRKPYRTKFPEPDWHQLAEQAAQEQDPKKLAHLIQVLCDRLEDLQRSMKSSTNGDHGVAESSSERI